jgi:transcriptional regulator with XRE-family HTH domain
LRDLSADEILVPLQGEEGRRVSEGSQAPGKDRAVGEPEPAIRGGGLPLPGLKHWRLRRGLSQRDLALRADVTVDYLSKIESGRRGCNPSIAQHLADLLEVDLLDLRRKYDGAEEQQKVSRTARPARIRIAHRQVHQVYLKMLLAGAVGSAYAAMDEWAMEKHCEKRSWEEVLEDVRARKREIEFLGGVLESGGVLQDPDLPEEVRSFLESVLESYPDLDIHLLAMARWRETSEEGREALTKAMRDLL